MPRIVRTSISILMALAALAFAVAPAPAAARGCGAGSRAPGHLAAPSAPAFGAQRPAAVVTGGGAAVIIDPNGEKSPLQFAVAGVIATDGSAGGSILFVFRKPFARTWGAVPGVDSIRLTGKITAGLVDADGTAVVRGTLTETDSTDGKGVVFVAQNEPFEIVTRGAVARAFSLQWCLLPAFRIDIARGGLRVHQGR